MCAYHLHVVWTSCSSALVLTAGAGGARARGGAGGAGLARWGLERRGPEGRVLDGTGDAVEVVAEIDAEIASELVMEMPM